MKKLALIQLFALLFLTACAANNPIINTPFATPSPEPSATITRLTDATETPVKVFTRTPAPFPMTTTYAHGLKMDIYLPETGEPPYPVVLALHGGGSSKKEFAGWAKKMSEKGYALVAPNYRGSPVNPLDPTKSQYPVALEDSTCALAWLFDNAETYHFDTGNVALLGFSLGGTQAAMLGTVDDLQPYLKGCPVTSLPSPLPLKGVIPISAQFDYQKEFRAGLVEWLNAYFGKTYEEDPERWKEGSPINYVDGSEPPFLVLQGKDDAWVNPEQSADFEKALKKVGVEITVSFLAGEHMTMVNGNESKQAVLSQLSSWFAK
ncbi:MAG TPA: alpha/beta hydrolase [Anaerolineaceae bacterium]|nr:alpha/beta hydrolase [Anaerolineaceae bacterium]HPN51972.1 alpha/beta hydrolase [Anaerolineaceae bacterium]